MSDSPKAVVHSAGNAERGHLSIDLDGKTLVFVSTKPNAVDVGLHGTGDRFVELDAAQLRTLGQYCLAQADHLGAAEPGRLDTNAARRLHAQARTAVVPTDSIELVRATERVPALCDEVDRLREAARDTARMFGEVEHSGELYHAPLHRQIDLLTEVAGGHE